MATRGDLRASDADREQVADRLRRASTEGRLGADELDQRLGAALRARTYGELDAIVADLPGGRIAYPERHHSTALALARPALALALIVPLVMAIVFLVTGVLAVWMVWAALGWWLFGHKRGCCGARHRRDSHRRGHGMGTGRAGAAPGHSV
ncbi:MAG: DUF1707 SHOCT-like domain-containing protein [Solirubrobacteraceae bacterium]